MIMAALALAFSTLSTGQQASADPPESGPPAAVMSRKALMLRNADAAAASGIPAVIADAPEKGMLLPLRLYMPVLDDFYPPDALRADQQGLVRLKCTLTIVGTLDACTLNLSSGVASLDAAAFEVARFARYSPHIVDRVPQAGAVVLPVRWVIGD